MDLFVALAVLLVLVGWCLLETRATSPLMSKLAASMKCQLDVIKLSLGPVSTCQSSVISWKYYHPGVVHEEIEMLRNGLGGVETPLVQEHTLVIIGLRT